MGHHQAAAALRARFPKSASRYKRVIRPLLDRREPFARLDAWVAAGSALVSDAHVAGIVVEANGRCWLRESDGYEWLYQYGRSGMLGLKEGRRHEEGELLLLSNALAGGGTLVDIGANIGYFSVRLASANPNVRVLAVEAAPLTYNALEANIRRNHVEEQVIAKNLAASNVGGRGFVTIDRGPTNHLVRTNAEVAGTAEVEVRRIDEVLVGQGLGKLTVVKCDVEGAELPALQGMEAGLVSDRPHILVEVEARWTRRFDYVPEDLFTYLSSLGYKRHLVLGGGRVAPATNLHADLLETNNFWCTHAG